MSNSLFNISSTLIVLFDDISNNDGEISPEQEKLLEISQEELQTKSLNYKNFLSSLNNDCSAIDNEIKRLEALKLKKIRLQNKLEDTLLKAVINLGIEKPNGVKELNFPTFSLRTRKSTSVEVQGPVEDKYKNVDIKVSNLTPSQSDNLAALLQKNNIKFKADVKISKTEIKKDLDNQVVVLNARFLEKQNLIIE